MQHLRATCQRRLGLWFQKRNLIIVSEHKVKHISLGTGTQILALLFMAGCVSWVSYSTGKFMAAKSTLKEQDQALREIVGSTPAPVTTAKNEPAKAPDTEENTALSFSALDNLKLTARVAYLEKQVSELQTTNETIVQRVREKTAGRIDALEAAIKHTGLDTDKLKKEANKSAPKNPGQGGPYIPVNSQNIPSGADEMFADLERLSLLQRIVDRLPLAYPIKNASLESSFGRRIDPFNGHLAFHAGLDMAGPVGAKIYASANGKVSSAGRRSAYGNAVDIVHGSGLVTRYGHLSKILVKPGQVVEKGDVVGIQGSTGRSTGQHLHYEVRYNNQPINPKKFLEAGRVLED